MAEKKTGLYICFPCKTIEEIPDYVPEDADRDPRIGFLVESHLRKHPSFEDRILTEWCSLGSVPTADWVDHNKQKQIKDKVLEGHGLTGFDAEFYATKATFQADALNCYSKHGRPDYTGTGCQDFLSASKELKPQTGLERKVAGLPKYDDVKVKRSFLCEYCPYFTQVQSIERLKKGK